MPVASPRSRKEGLTGKWFLESIVLCFRTKDACLAEMMKSQDILLLLKLVSLDHQERQAGDWVSKGAQRIPDDWQGWDTASLEEEPNAASKAGEVFSVRALEEATGISKSEVSAALRRCIDVGLAKLERKSNTPRANTKALYDFIAHGLKYVFPAKPGPLVRGIETSYAAPVLAGRLMSAGEHIYVWADAMGSAQGQRIEPLFKSVPKAVRKDAELYAMLALVDAIRLGNERESAVAKHMLEQHLRGHD